MDTKYLHFSHACMETLMTLVALAVIIALVLLTTPSAPLMMPVPK